MTALAADQIRRRLRADDRRHQLLDTAAAIVVAHGAAAMSMERLAADAGVSKALPYKHFDNVEAVLVELYRRETRAIGRAVWHALRDSPTGTDRTRTAIHAYFDELSVRRDVLAALTRPGSTVASTADPDQAGVIFEVDVFTTFAHLDRVRAKEVAGIVQGAIVGAAGTWLAGHGRRDHLENDLVAIIDGLLRRR